MFSIIISIYRVEKYLRQCIESVLGQTFSDFELLLIDDGSPDSCPQICDEYAALDSRIRVIHKENGGLMSTRKTGVTLARGQYICFIDGDDFVQSDMLATYVSILEKNNTDIISCGHTRFFENSTPVNQVFQKIPCGFYDRAQLEDQVYPRMLSSKPFFSFGISPSVCSKCIRRELAEKIYSEIPMNLTLGEDAAATYPALLLANSLYVSNYSGYNYRQNSNSMTHTYDKDLHVRLNNLLEHLAAFKTKLGWNDGQQLDEYSLFLLYCARNNELLYNRAEKYRTKKEKLISYLTDTHFYHSIRNVQAERPRDRFVIWCFKHRIILPLYLWSLRHR